MVPTKIWRSSNGNDWTNIIPDEFPDVYGRTAIGISPSNENEVYFLTSETEGQGQFTNTFLKDKHGPLFGNIPIYVIMVKIVVVLGLIFQKIFLQTDQQPLIILIHKEVMIY